MKHARVGILMGSESDHEVMNDCVEQLRELEIEAEVHVLSAHRNPEATRDFARQAAARGVRVLIAGAGMAAHLAGALASETVLPVIGVPLPGGLLGGLDALLSTVQMPRGVPVACMAVGRAGAANAAFFAAEILALEDDELRRRLLELRRKWSS